MSHPGSVEGALIDPRRGGQRVPRYGILDLFKAFRFSLTIRNASKMLSTKGPNDLMGCQAVRRQVRAGSNGACS